ncbi:MAG: metallophosphoesterase [Methanobacteriaceae archaeon]|nr:metallophosphoesterase [Methanobacteriaceae archaeon]
MDFNSLFLMAKENILAVSFVIGIGCLVGLIIGFYIFKKMDTFLSFYNVDNHKKPIKWIVAFLFFISCINVFSLSSIIAIYFVFSSVISDIINFICEFISGKVDFKALNFVSKLNKSGILAIIIFAILIISGLYGINHIQETDYEITSDKVNESYTVLFISDTHYGTIQDTQLFKNAIVDMNNLKPDIVILGGDMVDDSTSKAHMKEIFREISKINSTYGTYYIYGNHDRSSKSISGDNDSFSEKELNNTIKSNNITILSDDKKELGNILLIGRNDKGFSNLPRLSSNQLLNGVDLSKFIIVADHQPKEYEENSKNGADLQVSGHTHGGQIFPMNIIYDLVGILNYGEYKIGNMTHITSSGFTGWGWPLKNANPCEYVVIHINPSQ